MGSLLLLFHSLFKLRHSHYPHADSCDLERLGMISAASVASLNGDRAVPACSEDARVRGDPLLGVLYLYLSHC